MLPDAPTLWQFSNDRGGSEREYDDDDLLPPTHDSVPDMSYMRSPIMKPRRSAKSLHVKQERRQQQHFATTNNNGSGGRYFDGSGGGGGSSNGNSNINDYSERAGGGGGSAGQAREDEDSFYLGDEDSHRGDQFYNNAEDVAKHIQNQNLHYLHTGGHQLRPQSPMIATSAFCKQLPFYRKISLSNILHVLVLLVLATIIYDSHHRVKAHKVKLKEYDEERAHILEQMMWIDKAAKKLHNKVNNNNGDNDNLLGDDSDGNNGNNVDPAKESKDQLVEETKQLRDELDQLQLRIQLNARDRIHDTFGDKPLQISLKLPTLSDDFDAGAEEGREVLVALSDDTPHAVSTLLEQMDGNNGLWDEMDFQPTEDGNVVQVTSKSRPASSPMLEFAEKSRGCHEVGSVALRSTVVQELNVLVLRIHLVDNAHLSENDVCIGKVEAGMGWLRNIPTMDND